MAVETIQRDVNVILHSIKHQKHVAMQIASPQFGKEEQISLLVRMCVPYILTNRVIDESRLK